MATLRVFSFGVVAKILPRLPDNPPSFSSWWILLGCWLSLHGNASLVCFFDVWWLPFFALLEVVVSIVPSVALSYLEELSVPAWSNVFAVNVVATVVGPVGTFLFGLRSVPRWGFVFRARGPCGSTALLPSSSVA